MNAIKTKIKSLFRKNKDLIITNNKASLEQKLNNSINEEDIKEKIKNVTELSNEYLNKSEDIKLRIQAFSLITNDLEFSVAYYNNDTGIIRNINSKLFSDLDSIERVTWAYSQTSADIIYGYKDINNNLIVSSKYILNAIEYLKNINVLGDILYEVKSRRIIVKENSKTNLNDYVILKAYSVCGIVHITKELSERGYKVIKV